VSDRLEAPVGPDASAERRAEYWKANTLAANAEIERLRNAIDLALFHLRRNDHVTPPTGERCTRQMIDALECALASNTELSPGESAALSAGLDADTEWRWVDEQGRAMTHWKKGAPPPVLDTRDEKGAMRVEVRLSQESNELARDMT
jgi:hypothetical protein